MTGEIIKRFVMRGKFVVIAVVHHDDDDIYSFKITDKCNQKDYFSHLRYDTFEDCERDCVKVCKGV